MTRPIPDAAVALVKHFEGLRLRQYLCPARHLTIGYGHAVQPDEDFLQGIGEAEADALLAHDLELVGEDVLRLTTGPLTDGQYGALTSFVFNLGASRLAASTLLKKQNAGDAAGAAAEFVKWDKCNGIDLPGIKARREAEAQLFATGRYP